MMWFTVIIGFCAVLGLVLGGKYLCFKAFIKNREKFDDKKLLRVFESFDDSINQSDLELIQFIADAFELPYQFLRPQDRLCEFRKIDSWLLGDGADKLDLAIQSISFVKLTNAEVEQLTILDLIGYLRKSKLMKNQKLFLQRACQELELIIVVPFSLTVRNGIQINAQALLPQLGAPKGVIVVNHYDDLCGVSTELPNMGYGYSVLDELLPLENYDLQSYINMFSDWGWGNVKERKPDWMS